MSMPPLELHTRSAHLSLGANPIYLFGTKEQKQQYVAPLAVGDTLVIFAAVGDRQAFGQ